MPAMGSQAPHMMQVQPFGARHGGPPRDPFEMMENMMESFGGGGLFGGMFRDMDRMMLQGQNGLETPGSHDHVLAMGGGLGSSGQYSCQTMMFSSTMGPDGQMHSEKFVSSSVGDHGRQIQEVQQAYSNSTSGVDKMSMERQMGDRARKMVKMRNQHNGEEQSTDLFRGMEEHQAEEFNQQWRTQAAPYLPSHALGAPQYALGSAGDPIPQYHAGQRTLGQGGRVGIPAQRAITQAAPQAVPQVALQGMPATQGYPRVRYA